jgi:hypothetical protein
MLKDSADFYAIHHGDFALILSRYIKNEEETEEVGSFLFIVVFWKY